MSQRAHDMRAILEAGDVEGLRAAWAEIAPRLPQPKTRAEAEIVLHVARTESVSVEFKARAYSHAWLSERGLPSRLPDHLRPRAERLYPRVVTGIGISVNARSELFKPIVPLVRAAMENAVLEAAADGKLEDGAHVRTRMFEARQKTLKSLLGRTA